MKLFNLPLLINLILSSTIACMQIEKPSKGEEVLKILEKEFKSDNLNLKVFILNSYGCPVCNKSYAKYMLTTQAKNRVFYISDNGEFLKQEELQDLSVKIIHDYQNIFIRNRIIEAGPAFINVVDNRVDTIMHIVAERFQEQIKYIDSLHCVSY